jgi:hypothetical protein
MWQVKNCISYFRKVTEVQLIQPSGLLFILLLDLHSMFIRHNYCRKRQSKLYWRLSDVCISADTNCLCTDVLHWFLELLYRKQFVQNWNHKMANCWSQWNADCEGLCKFKFNCISCQALLNYTSALINQPTRSAVTTTLRLKTKFWNPV